MCPVRTAPSSSPIMAVAEAGAQYGNTIDQSPFWAEESQHLTPPTSSSPAPEVEEEPADDALAAALAWVEQEKKEEEEEIDWDDLVNYDP